MVKVRPHNKKTQFFFYQFSEFIPTADPESAIKLENQVPLRKIHEIP